MAHLVESKLQLITRRIPEHDIYGEDILKKALSSSDTPVKTLWATSPTGKPHIGYFIPMLKFAEFIKAGVKVVVLLLDVYSFLDNVKFPWEQVAERAKYYKYCVEAMLKALSVPMDQVEFVLETAYQFGRKFVSDQWRLCVLVPQQAVRDAWDRSYNPNILAPMLCPGMQSLAEEHLGVHFQFGGEDQRGIFEFAERFLPQLGYEKRAHLMNPMLPNLHGGKMSAAHPPNTKIVLLDDPDTVRAKLLSAEEVGGPSTKNGAISCLEHVIIPISELRAEGIVSAGESFCSAGAPKGTVFSVNTTEDGDGWKHFKSLEEIEKSLLSGEISRPALIEAVAKAINELLGPLRREYDSNKGWQEAGAYGYPELA